MDRRGFLQTGAAGCLAAIVPVPTIAAAPASYTPGHYAWAVAAAKSRSAVSESILAQSLKVNADQAAALMAKLQARGVVELPNAAGLSKVVSPVFRATGFTGGGAISSGKIAKVGPLKDRAMKTLERSEPALNDKSDEDISGVTAEDEIIELTPSEDEVVVNPSADGHDQPVVSGAVRSAE